MHILSYTCTDANGSRTFTHKFETYHQAENAMLMFHIQHAGLRQPWTYSDWSIDGKPVSAAHMDFLVDEAVQSALGHL